MRLDPAKKDFAALVEKLERLRAFNAKGERDWPADTIKTLKSGRLEDCDVVEFVVDRYDRSFASAGDDIRPRWEHSRALLGLIAELDALKLGTPKTDAVREALEAWKLD